MLNFTRAMRLITCSILLVVALSVDAQNTFVVETEGLTFVPQQVTISVGDTVRWFNTGGSHNVNGTLSAYPENPEPFGIGVGSGWVYAHKFTLPGTYNYHCDPHVGLGMTGVVIVEDVTTGLDDQESGFVKHVYPVPANEFVVLSLNEELVALHPNMRIKLFDQTGREHISQPLLSGTRQELDIRSLPGGLYIYQLLEGEKVLNAGKIVVQ